MGCKCQDEAVFAKFTEHNDWEGETWHHYLPVEGNEFFLARLSTIILELDPEGEEFELDLENLLDESEVDVLVKHSDSGYMFYHNKVTGRMKDFNRDDVVSNHWDDGSAVLDLGKGDIEYLFEKED